MGVSVSTAPQRIGLFGGAFDPPHDAHVALARAAIEQLALDRLHIAPTGDAWHKSRPLSPASHRLAMCRLAFGDVPKVVVDERELRRNGPTYTVDTLIELRAEYPGAALFLQIGADQAAAFHTWHRAADLLQLATVSIAARAVTNGVEGQFDVKNPLPKTPAATTRILTLPALAHSATEVRRRVAAGLSVDGLVSAPVARYIAEHHLYKTPA
ncbi:nicotinate (nicotinamide) nucleotide adenylyltransferase [Ottowia sp.]|uniref:nicotinate (nicotinamide) nucleotide adenylyltransferase n=1 Tax=Ottowia sp. TaxID=1898956 RepID=UPI003A84BBC7